MLTGCDERYASALKQAGQFIAMLHEKGVLHLDLSPGNLLAKKVGDDYQFFLIDVNRMKFTPVDTEQGIKNLMRLMEYKRNGALLAKAYAEARGLDEQQTLRLANQYADRHFAGRARKAKLKRYFKRG